MKKWCQHFRAKRNFSGVEHTTGYEGFHTPPDPPNSTLSYSKSAICIRQSGWGMLISIHITWAPLADAKTTIRRFEQIKLLAIIHKKGFRKKAWFLFSCKIRVFVYLQRRFWVLGHRLLFPQTTNMFVMWALTIPKFLSLKSPCMETPQQRTPASRT